MKRFVLLLGNFVVFLAVTSPLRSQNLIEYPAPFEEEFPAGYDLYDTSGKLLKTIPGPTRAKIQAYFEQEGRRLYLSDWSFERYKKQGIRPNLMVAREAASVVSAPMVPSHAEDKAAQDADLRLNESYRAAMRSGMPAVVVEKLKISQRAWLAYRDSSVAAVVAALPDDPAAAAQHLGWETLGRTGMLTLWFVQRGQMRTAPDGTGLAQAELELNAACESAYGALSVEAADALRQAQKAWTSCLDADLAALRAVGAISSDRGSWFYSRAETERRSVFLVELARKAGLHSRPPALIGPRLIWEPIAGKGHAAVPKPDERGGPVPTVEGFRSGFGHLVLDMSENLLARVGSEAIDFWDVSTGSLIRTIPLVEKGDDGLDAGGNGCGGVYVGGGRIAAMQTVNRERERIVCLYSRSDDSRLLTVGGARPDEDSQPWIPCHGSNEMTMTSASGGLVLLDYPEDVSAPQELLFCSKMGDWRRFRIPADPDWQRRWRYSALSRDGQRVALASDSRAITFDPSDGSVIADIRAPGNTKWIGMRTCLNADGFVLCSDSGVLFRLGHDGSILEPAGELPLPAGEKNNFRFSGTSQGWSFATFWQGKTRLVCSAEAPAALNGILSSSAGPSVTVDDKGEYAAVDDGAGVVTLHHLATGLVVRTFGTTSPAEQLVEISPDGRTLMACHRTSAGMVEVNLVSTKHGDGRTIDAASFDRLVGSDSTMTRLLVQRRQPNQFGHPLESSPLLESPVSSRSLSFGVLDLGSGETAEKSIDSVPGGWRFFHGPDLLAGWQASDLLLLDPFAPESPAPRRVTFKHLLPPDFEAVEIYLHGNSESLKLAVMDRSFARLVSFEISSTGTAKRVGYWDLGEEELFRNAWIQFSHEGHHLAILRELKFSTHVSLLDQRKPGTILWSKNFGSVDSCSFSADDHRVTIDSRDRYETGCSLQLLDTLTGSTISVLDVEGHSCRIASEGSRALVTSREGFQRIIKVFENDLVEIASFILSQNGDRAFFLPDGHYLSTGDAYRHISFEAGGASQPAEALDIRYNRPDLVAKELGVAPEKVLALRRAYEKRLQRLGIEEHDLGGNAKPPVAAIDYNRVPPTTDHRMIRLPVKLKPGEAPLVALEVTVNDVPLFGRKGRELLGSEARSFVGDLEIELTNGNNKITVWGRDAKGLTSSRLSVNVASTAERARKPSLFLLAVGINDYRELGDLSFAAKDAEDIIAAFKDSAGPAFAEVKALALLDHAATRKSVLESRSFLSEAGVEDQVVIFIAGHGVLDADYEYRFCTADADLNRLEETSLTYGEIESLLDGCRARHRIVFLDTCHAGEPDRENPVLAGLRVDVDPRVRSVPFQPVLVKGAEPAAGGIIELLDRHFVDLRIGAGAAVLASSSAEQQALEMDEVNNGLFTAALLKGIKRRQADLDGDGTIRASELLDYCKAEVRQLSGGVQEPVARHVNLVQDFAVITNP